MTEKNIPETEIINQTESVAKTGNWQLNLVSNELYWSKGVYRILEMEPSDEKLNTNKGLEVIHPDDRGMALEKMTQAINLGIEYRIKKRFITANNKIKHIISSGKFIKDENNNPIKLVGVFQDITEFVETNKKMELLNKITKDVIYDWDIQDDIFNWGESFNRVFGYKLNDKLFRLEDWIKLMHPSDIERLNDEWEVILKDKNANQWNKEFRFRKSDNSFAYIQENAIIIRDSKGIPIKMIGLLRDTTAKKINSIQKKLQNQISLIFKENKKTEDILEDILAYLTKYNDFVATELWLLNPCKTNIALKKWATKNDSIKKSYENAFNFSKFSEKQGFSEIIWKEQKHQIWKMEDINNYFFRNGIANDIGINSLLGVPLFNNSEFIGTLLFFSRDDLTLEQLKTEPNLVLCNYLGAEIKRKMNEEMNEMLFESTPDIITITNSKGYFTKVNPTFRKLLGYSEKELTSKPFISFVHPKDVENTANEYKGIILKEKKTYNLVNRYRTKNGNYKWISWSSSDFFGDENNHFAFGKDISEITELQNLFHEKTKLAEIGNWEYHTGHKSQNFYLSNIVKEILELENNENINLETLLNFTIDKDQKKTKKSFYKLINKGEKFDIEFQIKTKKDNLKWVRCIGKPEYNFDNKLTKILGSIQNITHKKVNELDLAQKNIFLSSITSVISELIHADDWYESLNKVFQITANTINVDRIYYFELDEANKDAPKTCSQKFEWTKNGIGPQIGNPELKKFPMETFADFFDPFKEGKLFSGITSQLPEGSLKEIFVSQSIKSFLVIPLFINNVFHGFIGFDDCMEERNWSISELSFLSNIVFNLATTIQRIKTNDALQKSLKEKNDILESIGDAFISLDKNWNITYWNNKTEKITGLKREQVLGENLWTLFPQIKKTIHEIKYKEALTNQQSVSFQTFSQELNIWVEVSVYPSKTGLSIYYKDITSTKAYEDNLRASNDRFEKSTAATNDAIWDWDIEKNSLYRGEGFTKSFGYKLPSFIYDSNIIDLIKSKVRQDQADEVINSLKEAINNPKTKIWKTEYWYKKANNEFAYIINNGVIIRNEKGIATRIVGALQDITSIKEQEDSLRILNKKLEKQTKALLNSNQELEQFAYIASHDLQEPLRMVTSFLTLLEKKYNNVLDSKGKQYIYFAVDGANRMRNIILDILEYSRIGKVKEINEQIELNELVEEICTMNSKKITETNAKINYSSLPTITGFKTPITQIFHNLIGNALKYQKPNENAVIKIKAVEEDKNWHFKIEDNGIGIDKEFHNKIFVIFQRLHTKQEFGGSGMGLAIVKKIIENLNGTIWVESESGKGATFHFTLPKK